MTSNSKNAYLAVGYACNQRCRCCPLIDKEHRKMIVSLDDIKKEATIMKNLGVTDVTISGGEPTIHPNFFEIIDFFFDQGIAVHILSNGEKFADKKFLTKFLQISRNNGVSVTTTFHSHIAEEHEYQNQSKGSFERSLSGIRALDINNINVSVKHCITSNNYNNLPQFLDFVLNNFSVNAEIQFWGIDLCGIDEQLAKESFVDYKLISKFMEITLDLFESRSEPRGRVLTINNLPLCMLDAYYWKYFTSPEMDTYIEHMQEGRKMDAISGPASKRCFNCGFRAYCPGVYYSNFDIIGDDIVSPPPEEMNLVSYNPAVVSYCGERIDLTYISPFVQIELRPSGFRIWNIRTGECASLRIKTEQMKFLLKNLENGVLDEDLLNILAGFNVDAQNVMNELMLKGIIE